MLSFTPIPVSEAKIKLQFLKNSTPQACSKQQWSLLKKRKKNVKEACFMCPPTPSISLRLEGLFASDLFPSEDEAQEHIRDAKGRGDNL